MSNEEYSENIELEKTYKIAMKRIIEKYKEEKEKLKGKKVDFKELDKFEDFLDNNEDNLDDVVGIREAETRLGRFKEWAKKNMLGLSALSITIAGLITTIVVSTKKALVAGAKAVGGIAKKVYEIGKKLGGFAGAVLGVIASILSAGTKGLIWLAKNLWVLAIFIAWFIYDRYVDKK